MPSLQHSLQPPHGTLSLDVGCGLHTAHPHGLLGCDPVAGLIGESAEVEGVAKQCVLSTRLRCLSGRQCSQQDLTKRRPLEDILVLTGDTSWQCHSCLGNLG